MQISLNTNSDQIYKVDQKNVFVPSILGKNVQVSFNKGTFSVGTDEQNYLVNSYDVKGLPADLTQEKLELYFQNQGYLKLKPLDNGDIVIQGNVRILGGSKRTPEAKKVDGYIAAGGIAGSVVGGPGAPVAAGMAAANSALQEGGHRSMGSYATQGGHRTPKEWMSQGDHRSVGEWFSGAPSRNKK